MNSLLSEPGRLGGVAIYENVNCLEKTDEPVRRHQRKPWMSDRYHARIQKKWIKRWGWVMKPCAFRTPQGIICHPTIARDIRVHLTRSSSSVPE